MSLVASFFTRIVWPNEPASIARATVFTTSPRFSVTVTNCPAAPAARLDHPGRQHRPRLEVAGGLLADDLLHAPAAAHRRAVDQRAAARPRPLADHLLDRERPGQHDLLLPARAVAAIADLLRPRCRSPLSVTICTSHATEPRLRTLRDSTSNRNCGSARLRTFSSFGLNVTCRSSAATPSRSARSSVRMSRSVLVVDASERGAAGASPRRRRRLPRRRRHVPRPSRRCPPRRAAGWPASRCAHFCSALLLVELHVAAADGAARRAGEVDDREVHARVVERAPDLVER